MPSPAIIAQCQTENILQNVFKTIDNSVLGCFYKIFKGLSEYVSLTLVRWDVLNFPIH